MSVEFAAGTAQPPGASGRTVGLPRQNGPCAKPTPATVIVAGLPALHIRLDPCSTARHRAVAIRTIDRLFRARRKRHLCRSATLRAHGIVHRSLAARSSAIPFAGLAAGRAAAWLVLKALLRVEFLLAGRKDEFRAAIAAGERSILKGHVIPRRSTIWKRKIAPRPMVAVRNVRKL